MCGIVGLFLKNKAMEPQFGPLLAEMLGVQRPSVSAVASAFQRAGMIEYSRGNITVLDDLGAIADRVAMLHDGLIRWSGPVAEMDATPDPYVQQFIHGRATGPIAAVR